MPAVSTERNAKRFINDKCADAVKGKGPYLGFYSDVTEDGKIVVNAFHVVPGKLDTAASVRVMDKSVLMAVINPASVPALPKVVKEEKKGDNGKAKR